MPTFEVHGKCYAVDEDGFLEQPELWSEEVATDFAQTEAITELTEQHWKVINYIRKYYLQFGIAPMVRKVCKETGFKLNEIYQLFPSGPAKGACKLAGLPKPTGCV
ncbi:MAG: TusE/DsrC/DsvC family sulfur relay protein [Candidatus Korobacteraceae bacterium]